MSKALSYAESVKEGRQNRHTERKKYLALMETKYEDYYSGTFTKRNDDSSAR